METFELVHYIANTWALVAMFLFFIGVVLWVFRPGAKRIYREAAGAPFRNEDRPAETRGE